MFFGVGVVGVRVGIVYAGVGIGIGVKVGVDRAKPFSSCICYI